MDLGAFLYFLHLITLVDPKSIDFLLRVRNEEEQTLKNGLILIPEEMVVKHKAKYLYVLTLSRKIHDYFNTKWSSTMQVMSRKYDWEVNYISLPLNKLILKENVPIMLLRNLDLSDELRNDSRMDRHRFNNIIHAKITI
ncbi:hypothetical protein H5410_010364 [Solanum commersonii]|uniref:DNA helicase Pif1-like 2B domain-containing protein n=1 Tax=Solanum commersonii TaxID=4109 RepID=A0A9J6AM18_SOLCO|nr:hypothetical protein H5410_010364 [Solanum commersonii]